MTPQQAQQQISEVFSEPFDRERYTAFLRNVLNKVEPRDKQYSGPLLLRGRSQLRDTQGR